MKTARREAAELIQTMIQVAREKVVNERARLGRDLTADEVGRIVDDVQRIAREEAGKVISAIVDDLTPVPCVAMSMTQDRRLSGYNYARS